MLFRSGWNVQVVDGHNVFEIDNAIRNAKVSDGKPNMIILNTIKGYGYSKSFNKRESHSMQLTKQMLLESLDEIGIGGILYGD